MSLAGAWHFAAVVHQFRSEGQAAQERAEAAIALSSKQGFAFFSAMGSIERGWALVEQGQREEGITQMDQGLMAYHATGAELYRPYFLALLAAAHAKVGQVEQSLAALVEALALVDKTGARFIEAELYRLKGELLLTQEGSRLQAVGRRKKPKEAEGCFLRAIEIAQRQQAKSLELRAATSLARFWRQQGKQKEAHAMLAEIYNWFTEGFDTKDLREARVLLAELS